MSDKPNTYVDDTGLIFYRASAFGSCPRALYASRKGYSPNPYPPVVLQAFADGNANESVIQARVEQLGWMTFDHQNEVSFKCGPVVIVGHIDWMMKDADDNVYLCDAKALSDTNYKLWRTYGFERFPKYAWQLSIYARATKSPICMAVLNKETDELDITFYPTSPHTFSEMLERILYIESFVKGDSVDQPECSPDGFFCPYQHLHDTMFDDVSLSGGIDQLRQNKLYDLAAAYQSAKRAESTARNKAVELLHDIEVELKQDEKKIHVRKTGATKSIAINRVEQTRKSIDTELLGSYLRAQSHSLTEFERSAKSSYIRVTNVKKEATPGAIDSTNTKRLGADTTDGGSGVKQDDQLAEHSEVVS